MRHSALPARVMTLKGKGGRERDLIEEGEVITRQTPTQNPGWYLKLNSNE